MPISPTPLTPSGLPHRSQNWNRQSEFVAMTWLQEREYASGTPRSFMLWSAESIIYPNYPYQALKSNTFEKLAKCRVLRFKIAMAKDVSARNPASSSKASRRDDEPDATYSPFPTFFLLENACLPRHRICSSVARYKLRK
jgi:hypothetical protein